MPQAANHLTPTSDFFIFSGSPCDTCGSHFGGERHEIYDRENDAMLNVCTDCLMHIEYPNEYPRPEGF